QVRAWRDLHPRGADARLLGKAPSGGAFVLVPVRRFRLTEIDGAPARLRTRWVPDGLCLMRRGNQGRAGSCPATAALLARALSGSIAGQSYGVVPDGVVAVRPKPGMSPVPVSRNFYVYDAIPHAGPPAWCYPDGDCKPTHPQTHQTSG